MSVFLNCNSISMRLSSESLGSMRLLFIVCSYHVTYAFQSESRLYICQNVKELLGCGFEFRCSHLKYVETRSIFERRCCIQLRTSSSNSTSVSFLTPPSSLNLFPFMDFTFSSFWTHSRTLFRSSFNFFAALWVGLFSLAS